MGGMFLLGTIFLSPCPAQTTKTSVIGDVSGDGNVTMYDAALVARYVQGLATLTPGQIASADVNQDGKVTIDDANLIAQKAVGLIQQLPSTNVSYTFSTTAGLSGTIGANGISFMSLNGRNVIEPGSSWTEKNAGDYVTECGDSFNKGFTNEGFLNCGNVSPQLNPGNYPYPNELKLDFTKVIRTIEQVDANDFIVIHIYPNSKYTYTYKISGEDISITTQVDNNSLNNQLFYNLRFEGMALNFADPLGNDVLNSSNMDIWHDNYISYYGRTLFHPSGWNPLGAWFFKNNYYGVSFMPMDQYNQRNMVYEDWAPHPDYATSSDRYPTYLLEQPIAPGASATNTLMFRFSNDINFKHLLAPYKDNYLKNLPVAQYQPDARPILFTSEADSSYVTDNPYGYYPMNYGPNSGRRWDVVSSMTAYLTSSVDSIKNAGGQGEIFWAPQGWSWQGSPMYTPAMDQFPPVALTNIQNIMIPGFNNRNLKFGLEDRPDLDNTYGTWQQLSSDDPVAMANLLKRFDFTKQFNLTNQAGSQLYYLDSFGSTLNDRKIMQAIRAELNKPITINGNSTPINTLTFTEFNNDQVLPYTGFYTELKRNAQGVIFTSNITNITLAIYQWLVPQGVYAATIRDYNTITAEDGWKWLDEHKIIPLIFDCSIKGCTPVDETNFVKSLNVQYIDPATNSWLAYPLPAVPANFSAQAGSSTQINLSWNTVSSNDYNSYRIERSLDNGNTWQVLVTLMDNQTNFTPSFSDTGLNPATSYSYRIQVFNDFAGSSAYSAPASAVTPA